MAGYIIELYKNIISDEQYLAETSYDIPNLDNKAYITFGEFDKMLFFKADSFSRMHDVSEVFRGWVGDRQKLLLYELSSDNQLVYREGVNGKSGFYCKKQGLEYELCDKLFIGVTILQFKESQQESSCDVKECLNRCRENILRLIEDNQKKETPIDCSVFGFLGSYGVVVVWACDQFTEIMHMINIIKGRDVLGRGAEINDPAYKFISVFSVFAKNKDGRMENVKEIKGDAILQMTLQTNLNSNVLEKLGKNISEKMKYHSIGEYDLTLTTQMKNLYFIFDEGKILNSSSEFYEHNVLQTNLKLCADVDEEYMQDVSWTDSRGPQETNEEKQKRIKLGRNIREKYESLRKLFFEKFPKTTGMIDSLDLLYGDYNSKIALVSNKMWADDYGQQFLAILSIIETNIQKVADGEIEVPTKMFFTDIQDILNCFEYQTNHISESNNLLLDTPKCHLRYTGQNNLTLYAYFGILKDIIKLVYMIQNESKQSKIIPLISVETVPIIGSILFMDYGTPFEDRVIEFNFPMMAIYALPAYVPYLYHEVFHYVAPKDRVARNWYKACVLVNQAMKNIVSVLFRYNSGIEDKEIIDSVMEIYTLYIYETVVEKYDDEIVSKLSADTYREYKREEINEEALVWNKYEERLFYQLLNCISNPNATLLEDNLVYSMLVDLYVKKDEIAKQFEKRYQDSGKISDEDYELMTSKSAAFLEVLEGLAKNVNPESATEAFQELLTETGWNEEELIDWDELQDLSIALNEVACDLPMVELAKMDASTYLISYIKIQKDLLKKASDEIQLQHSIRIGIVLDTLFGYRGRCASLAQLKALKNDFVSAYVGFYYSDKKALENKHENIREYVSTLQEEAEKWFEEICLWYQVYLDDYRIYSNLIKQFANQASIKDRISNGEKQKEFLERFDRMRSVEYNRAVKSYGCGIIEAVNSDNGYSVEVILKRIAEAKHVFRMEAFEMNIEIIQIYQKQEKFADLSEIRDAEFRGHERYNGFSRDDISKVLVSDNACWSEFNEETRPKMHEYVVNDIGKLCTAIKCISNHFDKMSICKYGDSKSDLWYRGQKKKKYKLLPSAMRKYSECSDKYSTLRLFQRATYEEFRFRMDNASEIVDKASYTTCDYIALMQHYGVPTIYMDWAENAITALYFALEDFIDPKKANEQDDTENAVVYILHPNLYNEARNKMISIAEEIGTGRVIEEALKETKQKNTSMLPNLSVEYNEGKYYMFLDGEVDDEKKLEDSKRIKIKKLDGEQNKELFLYLPLAIYASRVNKRILAQSGMFMAFNIFTKPSEMNKFDYMALEDIQDFYLEYFKQEDPFMYKIEIEGGSKKEIAEWLKAIGVTKDMIYPELSNIGERIF